MDLDLRPLPPLPEIRAFAARSLPYALRRGAASLALLAAAGLAGAPTNAWAEAADALGEPNTTGAGLAPALPTGVGNPATPKAETPISFEADRLTYDDKTEVATASGNVYLQRDDRSLRADSVTYDRKTRKIIARGNIRLVDESGNQLFTDEVELTDDFVTGTMHDMLLALREGGRLAAQGGERRADGKIILGKAAYTGCNVVDDSGCEAKPAWKITARQVLYDPDRKLARFSGARFVLFGARLLPLPPIFVATDGRAISGLLIPNVRISSSNGFELSETYYYRIGDNRDLSATAYVFTKAAPMASFTYRALTGRGAWQATAYATTSNRIGVGVTNGAQQKDFRGYLDANGRFQFSPEWSASFSGRIATDRTFLRRYFISSDDVLRSTASLSRVNKDSLFSITGWAFQTMRAGTSTKAPERQGLVPIALPEIDYRRRLRDPLLGGTIALQVNSLAITRTDGQDTQRAFASARWDLRRVTPMGQQVTLTGLVRGDVYHSSDNALTTVQRYRGTPGWQTRGVATAAIDVTWPFIGKALGGTQVITPHVQVVATPPIRNLVVPNEDARAIELEDDNLFALNRFPGYDRIEDGTRFTYGLDYQVDIPSWRGNATIGQSYRLTDKSTLLPNGTGLSDSLSDVVGRVEVRYKDFVKLTERFRLDKDTLAVRRNEIDATIGSEKTYVEVGYSRLNRRIDATLEDLQDSEELRAAARVAFARYWSLFGSGIFDLSGNQAAAGQSTTSFQALRTRLGVAYRNDCLEIGFTWRRDYVTVGDAAKGNSFQLHLALKNLGLN